MRATPRLSEEADEYLAKANDQVILQQFLRSECHMREDSHRLRAVRDRCREDIQRLVGTDSHVTVYE